MLRTDKELKPFFSCPQVEILLMVVGIQITVVAQLYAFVLIFPAVAVIEHNGEFGYFLA